jgi:hypothetical protein
MGGYRGKNDFLRIEEFRSTRPDAPPPAKGRKYDDYVNEYNSSRPAPSPAAATPDAATQNVVDKTGIIPEADLKGAVQLAAANQLGGATPASSQPGSAAPITGQLGASDVTANAAVSGVGNGAAPPAPNMATQAPAPTSPATTSVGVGQLAPSSVAGTITPTGVKMSSGGGGSSTAQYNQTPITPQTGPATGGGGAAGINPAAAAAAARRANQNVSSASQYLMPNISGLRFGGF